jgi:hypothetical protein
LSLSLPRNVDGPVVEELLGVRDDLELVATTAAAVDEDDEEPAPCLSLVVAAATKDNEGRCEEYEEEES